MAARCASRWKCGQAEVLLSVADQGLGVAAEQLPQLFQPFHRVVAQDQNIPGIGLGLSVSRRIVEAHRGKIEVESTLGRGSVFRIRLPLVATVTLSAAGGAVLSRAAR